jgi:hypothetical protein
MLADIPRSQSAVADTPVLGDAADKVGNTTTTPPAQGESATAAASEVAYTATTGASQVDGVADVEPTTSDATANMTEAPTEADEWVASIAEKTKWLIPYSKRGKVQGLVDRLKGHISGIKHDHGVSETSAEHTDSKACYADKEAREDKTACPADSKACAAGKACDKAAADEAAAAPSA